MTAKIWQQPKAKIGMAIVLLALLVLLFSSFLPWWGFVVFSLVVGFIFELNDKESFMSGFLGASIPFLITMMLINSANDGILAAKMAETVNLSGAFSIILITAVVCGVLGGLAFWTGSLGRKLIRFGK